MNNVASCSGDSINEVCYLESLNYTKPFEVKRCGEYQIEQLKEVVHMDDLVIADLRRKKNNDRIEEKLSSLAPRLNFT